MRIKVVVPHPHFKRQHVQHTAALTTIAGGVLEIAHTVPYLGTLMLVAAGCIAIYEPTISHYVTVEDEHGLDG